MDSWDGPAMARRMAEDCGAFHVRHLARMLTRLYEDALRPHGVSLAQLEILASAAARGEPTLGRVAADTGAERSTVSRNVRSLVEAGLLQAQRTDTGRTRHVSLTDAGRDAFTRAHRVWATVHARTRDVLGPEDVATLEDWIGRVERIAAEGPER